MIKVGILKAIAKLMFIVGANLFILLSVVELASFDTEFYRSSFRRNSTESITEYSEEELMLITEKVISYLAGYRDDFDIAIDGEYVFGERETLHMIDVKELFERGFTIKWISLGLATMASAYLYNKDKAGLGKLLYRTSLVGLGMMVLLGAVIYLNFELAFELFHEVLFTNDLWLLNPNTDTLIQMLPLDFFYRLSFKIATMYGVAMLIALVMGISLDVFLLKSKKHE